jgi:hypothetical protein
MANQVTLVNTGINSGTAVKLLNSEFTYGWKNLTSANPSNTLFGTTETQFNGWENPLINLRFFININNPTSGYMTWALWNAFAKTEYLGTAGTRTYLALTAGSADIAFASYAASSTASAVTSIPVSVISYSLKMNPEDSSESYLLEIDAQLMETQ